MGLSVKFIKSATAVEGWPEAILPEVAITGRSNAGKSSLINGIAGRKIAKVSQTPGKTRLLNFFEVGEKYRLVDMPGYGYAARSGPEMGDWQKMIETYLSLRANLTVLVLVMDIRRDWTAEEEQLKRFANLIGKPIALALTKSDKLKRGPRLQRRLQIMKQAGVEHCYCVSAIDRESCVEFEDLIFRSFIQPVQ